MAHKRGGGESAYISSPCPALCMCVCLSVGPRTPAEVVCWTAPQAAQSVGRTARGRVVSNSSGADTPRGTMLFVLVVLGVSVLRVASARPQAPYYVSPNYIEAVESLPLATESPAEPGGIFSER